MFNRNLLYTLILYIFLCLLFSADWALIPLDKEEHLVDVTLYILLPNFCNRYHTLWYSVSKLLIILYFLFHGLHFATTLRVLNPVLCFRVILFNYRAKEVTDVDPACKCHQSNIVPDSIFSVNIAQLVTNRVCFLFCFILRVY